MTREEQREKASVEYQLSKRPMAIGGDAFADMVYKMNINPSFIAGAKWADENPNLEEWFDKIYVWLMNNDKLREMIGISNQYELMLELRKFLNNKHHEK